MGERKPLNSLNFMVNLNMLLKSGRNKKKKKQSSVGVGSTKPREPFPLPVSSLFNPENLKINPGRMMMTF